MGPIPGSTRASERRDEIVRSLEERLGAERVLATVEDRVCYGYDASDQAQPPVAAVVVHSVTDVLAVTAVARRLNVPLFPRGSGSGLPGGAISSPDGVVLVFTQMRALKGVDRSNRRAVAEPGLEIAQLNEALMPEGLWFPSDPATAAVATLGGAISTRFGEIHGHDWDLRHNVTALEIVTVEGEVLHLRAGDQEDPALRGTLELLIGSGGTLGVITEIAVRLAPRPDRFETLWATFSEESTAFETAGEILDSSLDPFAFELFGERILEAAVAAPTHPELSESRGALLLEFAGPAAKATGDANAAFSACRRRGTCEVLRGVESHQRQHLWSLRRAALATAAHLAPRPSSWNLHTLPSHLAEAARLVRAIEAKRQAPLMLIGGAEGNLHIVLCGPDPSVASALFEEIAQVTSSVGGHLGEAHPHFLPLEHTEREIEWMRRLKDRWDPQRLLNPGKIPLL